MGASSSSKASALKSMTNKDVFAPTSPNINLKLRLEPVQSVTGNEALPVTQRTAVLLTFLHPPKPATSQAIDDSSLYRVVVVTAQGIEEFCLVTGNRGIRAYSEETGQRINAAVQLDAGGELGKGVLLCTASSRFKFIDLTTLQVKATFEAEREAAHMKIEKDEIAALVALEAGQIAVGHLNGLVQVWTFGASEPRVTFNSTQKWEMPGVTRLAYSKKLKSVLSGHDNGYSNPQGRYFKLDSYEIRLYSVDFPAEDSANTKEKSSELGGFAGSCFDLKVSDAHSMAFALSSLERTVYIWSLQTFKLIFQFSIPQIGESSALATSLHTLSQPENKQILSFGMSDGTIVVSQLALLGDLRLSWSPLKLIKQRIEAKRMDQRQVTFIDYDPVIDMLAVGDKQSHVRLINNFVVETAPKQQVAEAPVEEGKRKAANQDRIDQIRKRVEGRRPEEESFGFKRFLQQRKEVLQAADPEKPYKDLLMEISEQWKQMSLEARQAYEPPPTDFSPPV